MSKNTTRSTKKNRGVSAALRKRAQAIIDSDDYNQDTRVSIAFELKTNDTDLADMVERAEQEETICDTIRVDNENAAAARQVMALLNSEIVPLWLRETTVEALALAARRIGSPLLSPALKDGKVTVADNPNPHFQDLRRNLANLLLFTQGNFSLRQSDRERLAEAISEILNNDLTPVRLHNELADFVTEISSQLMDDSPEIISKALAFGNCGMGRDCPGTTDGSVCPGPEMHPPDPLDASAEEVSHAAN